MQGLSQKPNAKNSMLTHHLCSLSKINPPFRSKVCWLSTVETIVETTMVAIRKCNHEFTSFLCDLQNPSYLEFQRKQFVVFCSAVSSQLHCANLQSGYTTICHHPVKWAKTYFFLIISSGQLMHKKQYAPIIMSSTVKVRLAILICASSFNNSFDRKHKKIKDGNKTERWQLMKHSITNRHTKHCNITVFVLDWDQTICAQTLAGTVVLCSWAWHYTLAEYQH